MTVSELIQQLQLQDPQLEVWRCNEGAHTYPACVVDRIAVMKECEANDNARNMSSAAIDADTDILLIS